MSNQYNAILNKVYAIIRKDELIQKYLYYKEDADIESKPPVPSRDLPSLYKSSFHKYYPVPSMNMDSNCFIAVKLMSANFNDMSSRQRGATQKMWTKMMFRVYVACSDKIIMCNGDNRILAIANRLQELFTETEVDAIGYAYPLGIVDDRTVDTYQCMAFDIGLFDKNGGVNK